jgi:hypothetical protein
VSSATLETPVSPRAHHLPAALVTVLALALVVVGAGLGGDTARLAAVFVLQAGLVVAWAPATGTGRVVGTVVVGLAAAVGADVAIELPDRPDLSGLLAVLGPAFLAVVLDQMLRRDRRDTVAALAGGVLLVCAVTALSVLLLVARATTAGADLTTTALLVVGAALLVGHLVDLVLPRPQLASGVPRGLPGLLLAVLAGALTGFLRRGAGDLVDGVSAVTFGAILGAVAALVAIAASYVAAEADAGGRTRRAALAVVQGLLPIAACAPVALALHTAL